jgi:hypothetical protein
VVKATTVESVAFVEIKATDFFGTVVVGGFLKNNVSSYYVAVLLKSKSVFVHKSTS